MAVGRATGTVIATAYPIAGIDDPTTRIATSSLPIVLMSSAMDFESIFTHRLRGHHAGK
jgi:hypothetical protein